MRLRFLALGLGMGLLSSLATSTSRAEPLSEQRSDQYYAVHSSLIAAGALGSGAIALFVDVDGPGYDLVPFAPDDAVRRNFSHSAAELSDKLLLLTATLPLAAQLSDGFDTNLANASLIYGEAHSLNLLVTTSVKAIVRRPRPYTHSPNEAVQRYMSEAGGDAYLSFFSGHASTAYTSATAGSILFAARTDELWSRHVMWGVEFLLAGITAELRVRAGRHYRTDVWTGTAVGLAIGFAVPALHGVPLDRIRPSEVAVAGGALAGTLALGPLWGGGGLHDVKLRTGDGSGSFQLLPAVMPHGGGIQAAGQF